MADDDLDLDAMLDSALDEEFTAPGSTAQATANEDNGDVDLDLDAMLDEAMVSAALDGEGPDTAKEPPATRAKASSGFGPSQEWLQRRQGGGGGGGGGVSAGTRVANDPFSFLRAERRDAWKATLEEDKQHQADMEKQRPFSRAYRSFYSAGKGEGDVVVHLGSGAATKGAGETSEGTGPEVPGVAAVIDSADGSQAADDMFEDVLGKGVASSGVKEPPVVGDGDLRALDRLKVSYLRLLAKDVRARVSKDPDVSVERFPGIVSKILA